MHSVVSLVVNDIHSHTLKIYMYTEMGRYMGT